MSSPSTQPVAAPEQSTQQVPASPAPRMEPKPFTIKVQGHIPG